MTAKQIRDVFWIGANYGRKDAAEGRQCEHAEGEDAFRLGYRCGYFEGWKKPSAQLPTRAAGFQPNEDDAGRGEDGG